MDKEQLTLREWREKRALSTRELAQLAGVNHVTIVRLENGHCRPRPLTRRRLAKALQIEPDQIVWSDIASRRA